MIRKAFPGDSLPVSSRHAEQVIRLPSRKDSDTQLDFSEYGETVDEVYFQFEQHLEFASSN
ncbi:hypothetical protein TSUD_202120 [Trifolium subterraneum]|uniref:Uncharacterized protein n=1 Tax=Trifolium subterraneum TaxID=3900 RepID=A0A2Z6M819_TRISU|nr:hypothetical protein TSUD_202120 [Trifolium subterraneum]